MKKQDFIMERRESEIENIIYDCEKTKLGLFESNEQLQKELDQKDKEIKEKIEELHI